MNILIVGLNHDTASIDVREKVAFDGPKLEEALRALKDSKTVKEKIILSTCNRVELYTSVSDMTSGTEEIKSFLADFHRVPRESLDKSLYVYSGPQAIRHLFRVSSSLDSMVVGEPQILGQLKDAFDIALKSRSTGVLLNRLMKKAVSVAKRTRTETKIGEAAVNISYAAVELAKKIFEDLSAKSVLLMGAGEMAELAAKHLISSGVKGVFVTNRTYERAEELALEFHGSPVRFEDFHRELLHVDIIICSTGAPDYVLRREEMHRIMKQRKYRPMFVIDIAVPRNIDPAINDLDSIYLYNTDDLQGVVEVNMQERSREAEKAGEIIDSEVEAFLKWLKTLSATPTIVALRQKAEKVRREELDKLFRKLGPIEEEKVRAIEHLSSSIVNKLIHPPTNALKSQDEDREMLVDTVRRLYDLEVKRNNEEG